MQEKWTEDVEEEKEGREEEAGEEEDLLHHQIRNREISPRKEGWGERGNKRVEK